MQLIKWTMISNATENSIMLGSLLVLREASNGNCMVSNSSFMKGTSALKLAGLDAQLAAKCGIYRLGRVKASVKAAGLASSVSYSYLLIAFDDNIRPVYRVSEPHGLRAFARQVNEGIGDFRRCRRPALLMA